MTFNLLIGDAYAHGKNLSLLHDRLGTTLLEDLDSIALGDIAAAAGHWGYTDRHAGREARELVAMVLEAAKTDTAPSHIRNLVRTRATLHLGKRAHATRRIP